MSKALPLEPELKEPTPTDDHQLEDLHRVVDEALVAIHFQPIVNLASREIFAFEALCRPQSSAFDGPEQLIEAATAAGRIGELGRLNRSTAVEKCPASPLFVNIDPHEFDQPWLVRPDDPIFRHKRSVYLEITETVPLKFFEHCHGVLAEVRKKGALLAIDDLGAGFSNLKYIADLEPDIVKLDRDLVSGCVQGSREFGLLKSITRLCHEMGAKVIAEGVEQVDELKAVLAAEIDYAQGYLLARPACPPPPIRWPTDLRWDWKPKPESPAPPPAEPEEQDAGEPADPAVPEIEDPPEVRADLRRELQELSEKLADAERHKSTLSRRLKMMSNRVDHLHRDLEELSASKDEGDEQPEELPTEGETGATERFRAVSKEPRRRAAMLLFPLLLAAAAASFFLFSSRGPRASSAAASDPLPASTATAAEPVSVATASMTLPGPAELPTVDPVEARVPGGKESAEATPSLPAVESTSAPEPQRGDVLQEATAVINRVNSWARAWSDQQVADYLSSYARSFQPPDGMSRKGWEAERRQRLLAPASISVAISELEVTLPRPDLARATFRQSYSSPTFGDETRKTLDLVLEDGDWKIAVERSDSL